MSENKEENTLDKFLLIRGSNYGKRKIYEFNFHWDEESIFQLLELRKSHLCLFSGERGSAIVGWKVIANKLDNGASWQQCRKKWENLQSKYKEIVQAANRHATNNEIIVYTWPFYEAIDEIVRMKTFKSICRAPNAGADQCSKCNCAAEYRNKYRIVKSNSSDRSSSNSPTMKRIKDEDGDELEEDGEESCDESKQFLLQRILDSGQKVVRSVAASSVPTSSKNVGQPEEATFSRIRREVPRRRVINPLNRRRLIRRPRTTASYIKELIFVMREREEAVERRSERLFELLERLLLKFGDSKEDPES